jgi:hypothetical protein
MTSQHDEDLTFSLIQVDDPLPGACLDLPYLSWQRKKAHKSLDHEYLPILSWMPHSYCLEKPLNSTDGNSGLFSECWSKSWRLRRSCSGQSFVRQNRIKFYLHLFTGVFQDEFVTLSFCRNFCLWFRMYSYFPKLVRSYYLVWTQ